VADPRLPLLSNTSLLFSFWPLPLPLKRSPECTPSKFFLKFYIVVEFEYILRCVKCEVTKMIFNGSVGLVQFSYVTVYAH